MHLFTVFAFFAALALYTLEAKAQQPAPPRDQALTQKLINEINNGLACNTALIDAQQQIVTLKAELAAKDKPADKKQDKAPIKK